MLWMDFLLFIYLLLFFWRTRLWIAHIHFPLFSSIYFILLSHSLSLTLSLSRIFSLYIDKCCERLTFFLFRDTKNISSLNRHVVVCENDIPHIARCKGDGVHTFWMGRGSGDVAHPVGAKERFLKCMYGLSK